MEIPIEYNLAGQSWGKTEDEQLIKEYNIDKLTLLEISKNHKRMPGGILSRLKRLNLIKLKSMTRGYQEYEQSDLYKTICNYRIENKNDCRILEENQILVNPRPTDRQTAKLQRKQIPSDIIQLKKDVADLKKDVKEILRLMNALYDFESQ